ncbi:MAG TPA: hypothetical protein ENO25_04015 [Desulfobacteraceae bacterium]|nr:hypothetical protein [Desulfobacteraceae bacterium]
MYSGEVSVELDILQRQFEHIKESSSCNGTLSAIYLLAASDPLMFHFDKGWSEGSLTALGLAHYQMRLDGSTYPLTYPEQMRSAVQRFDFELRGEYVHMARSAHAYAVKNLVEDITDLALEIGERENPVKLIARYNKRRETLDLETPGDNRLFRAIRENADGRTEQLRQDHDGWWLEGNRIVVPVSPLHYLGILEDYESEAWMRAARLLPFMRKIKDGGALSREEYQTWEKDLGWLVKNAKDFWRGRQESTEIGKITQLVREANDQVSKEGRVVAILGARLKSWTQQHHFLSDAYSMTDLQGSSLDRFKKCLSTVYAAGFPTRVELLKNYYMALSGNENSVFNLGLEIDMSNDVVPSPMTQYAMHRVVGNVILFAAQQAAGSEDAVQLKINFDGERLNFVNRGDRSSGNGALIRQFFVNESLQPGIVRSTRRWAEIGSADGRGLISNENMSEMSMVPTIASARDMERDYPFREILPFDRRPLAQYAHPAVDGAFLAFHPTSLMRPIK